MNLSRGAASAAALALLLAGCGGDSDGGTGPDTASLQVIVTTQGRVLDRDGYSIVADGATTTPVSVNQTVTLTAQSGTSRTLVLDGVRHNCTVAGGVSRTVQVASGAPTQVKFDVTCAASDMAFLKNVNGVYGLYVQHANGEQQLLTSPVNPSRVRWSRDGYRIAYTAAIGGGSRVWTIDVDSMKRVDLGGSGDFNGHPEWSPDGKQIIYFTNAGAHPTNIFRMNAADGSEITSLTPTANSAEQMPAWSPDGSQIAYVRVPGVVPHEIWTMRADGSNPRLVATIRNQSYGTIDWSPDGTQIVFSEGPASGGQLQIAIMNADGTNRRQVTSGTAASTQPTFTPDGRIAFYREGYIWTVNTDGSDARRLSGEIIFAESAPDWP